MAQVKTSRWANHIPNWERALGIESHKWMVGHEITESEFFKKWKEELNKARASVPYQRRLTYLLSDIREGRQLGQRKYEKGDVAKANRKKRYETDLAFFIKRRLRGRISVALRNQKKAAKTEELTGCSFDDFRKHIESLWTDGMSWNNYGRKGWHVDHIKACYKFDLSDPQQQRQCFHFSNLQPLWWQDNLRKDASEASALRNKLLISDTGEARTYRKK